MLESTGSIRSSAMPDHVTSTVTFRCCNEFSAAQSSGVTRHRVITSTWLVSSRASSNRSVAKVCGLTPGSIGSVARLNT
jgi:hypothetical protein